MNVYVVRLEELPDDLYQAFYRMLDMEKQQKIDRYLRREDALRSLLGDVLIRHIVKIKYAKKKICFSKNAFGKPHIEGMPQFHFNISHSGEWIVCVTGTCEVGIDIEAIKPINLNLMDVIFTDKESKLLLEQEESNRLPMFYNIWTLKEAYIKTLGKGMSIPLNSFDVSEFTNKVVKIKLGSDPVFLKSINFHPAYKMSVGSFKPDLIPTVYRVNINDLLSSLS
ncbi:4'-phosphopantetheinyl transferase family protein [Bacillus wiedmannii]|uniref:4'-phosphopantetheinyl transferase family protein n=1 Tax=Bacillus wiedmannii TaxID=1890302 RepID=UPI000B43CECD|nr:hypothetical protein BK740_00485 [Bacillus thuringiensis serovar argentinensis]